MTIREIGKKIHTLRTEQEISLEELGRGICSPATLSRLENGERRPDILVFNALWERLGRSAEDIDIVLTLEEFSYFVKRRNLEIALAKGERALIEKERKILEEAVGEEALKRQDLYRLQALDELQNRKDLKAAKQYLEMAVRETIEDPASLARLQKLYLSDTEITLLLTYGYLKDELGEDGEAFLRQMRVLIESKSTDWEAKNKRRAQIGYLLARIYRKRQEWKLCFQECEAVIAAEVENGTLIQLPQALQLETECLEHDAAAAGQKELAGLRLKQREALEAVIREFAPEVWEERPVLFFQEASQEKHLIEELIGNARLRREISQEELSAGICAPETLSRIETGKRNPTVKNFHALMEKLNIGLGYYNMPLDVEQMETLEKNKRLVRLFQRNEFEEADQILKEIREEVDMEIPLNRQYVEAYQLVIDEELGRIDCWQELAGMQKLLAVTEGDQAEYQTILKQPMSIEISLICQIALLYRKLDQREKAKEILLPVYEYFHQSKLRTVEVGKKYFLAVHNLTSLLEELDELEEAEEMSRKMLTGLICAGMGIKLGRCLGTRAYIAERRKKEKCLRFYEQAFYVGLLFQDYCTVNITRDHVWEMWKVKLYMEK